MNNNLIEYENNYNPNYFDFIKYKYSIFIGALSIVIIIFSVFFNNMKNKKFNNDIKNILSLNDSYLLEINNKIQQINQSLKIHNNILTQNKIQIKDIDNQLIFIGYDKNNKSLFVNKNINKLSYFWGDSNACIAKTLILSQLRFLNKIKNRLLLSEIAYVNLKIYFDDECTIPALNERSYPSNNNPLEEKITKMKYLIFHTDNINKIKELKENCIKYDINLILDFENIDESQKRYFI